jgi:hypothetical protein
VDDLYDLVDRAAKAFAEGRHAERATLLARAAVLADTEQGMEVLLEEACEALRLAWTIQQSTWRPS